MLSTAKWIGLLAVAFVAGSFVASPELRAYAANTIGSADIIDESIQSVDIKNGQVKASDIATDAVGAAEIQGVTKLLFGQCAADSTESTQNVDPTKFLNVVCTIAGVASGDSVIATKNSGNGCFEVERATAFAGSVTVILRNDCTTQQHLGTPASFGIMVFDK